MSASVNVPTNTKIKEKDINTKLQLYGIYSAFANGKVPSNKQIDVAMNTALEWKGLNTPSKKLSSEGQLLVADLRDVIEKTKIMLLSKNQGNLLQDFIWQTQSIGTNGVQKPGMPVEKDTAKQHGQEALEGLRTLGQLLITNGQFRKLLSDSVVLLRDIAGDAAQKAANRVNPSEDRLATIDQPAEDNTWHDAPDLSKENIKNQIQSRNPVGKGDLQDVSKAAVGTDDPNRAAEKAQNQQGDPNAGAQVAKEKASAKIPEEHKEKMREYRQKTQEYFKGKFPQERKDQLILRLKKMIVEIQMHSEYQRAIDTLLRLAEEYGSHGKNLAGSGSQTAKAVFSQSQPALTPLKTLLERFANSTSFDDATDSIDIMRKHAQEDPELRQWFRDLDAFVRRCLQEQGYVLQDESNQEWDKVYEKGRFLLRERYRGDVDHMVDEFKFLGEQFDSDPQNKAFAQSMDKLFKDLGNDSDGKPQFKPHLVKDLTEVLIPAFFENVRYVPIPRIEVSDPMIDAVVENLVIEGDNLAPNQFEFGSDNYWRWGRKGFSSTNKNKVLLSVSGIQMDLRDVAYYVKKKQGFPGVTDKGVMDLFMGGTGLSFKVHMETADKKDQQHFFKINSVTVDLAHLQIKLKQSNHKLLFNLFKPLLLKVIKPVIQKAVEKQVKDNVNQLDGFMWRVKQEYERAAEEAKRNPDPENIQNMYQQYFNAYQRELQKAKDKKEQAKAKASETQANVAMTQHDSIFKNIQLPGGISTKATEYKDLAAKGDKWESPVFSIGSAKETSSLPSISNPSRKPHSTRQPGIKDASRVASGQLNGSSQPGYNQY